ncbi:GNAT family N-acetyltransferase [Thalassobacillus sp. CUG 92003]|uniref:GNAT family N-acetyltransferase n=1 Tax=Thalassobacillus sp. CUG 92003 TaxID=2736641 RepID=UPI0015E6DE54|nr:GNAT family N-acetyltransferase [Thalassobacillus sp. CUG 92003]
MNQPRIKQARPQDAHGLSELAHRSKGHWGYDHAFLAACKENLTITHAYIKQNPVYVMNYGEEVYGFYSLLLEDEKLDFLYVNPDHIGEGIGRSLWQHIIETAAKYGLQHFTIDSDPYAESFYLKMGARRIGEIPSTVFQYRKLPLLHVSVS